MVVFFGLETEQWILASGVALALFIANELLNGAIWDYLSSFGSGGTVNKIYPVKFGVAYEHNDFIEEITHYEPLDEVFYVDGKKYIDRNIIMYKGKRVIAIRNKRAMEIDFSSLARNKKTIIRDKVDELGQVLENFKAMGQRTSVLEAERNKAWLETYNNLDSLTRNVGKWREQMGVNIQNPNFNRRRTSLQGDEPQEYAEEG